MKLYKNKNKKKKGGEIRSVKQTTKQRRGMSGASNPSFRSNQGRAILAQTSSVRRLLLERLPRKQSSDEHKRENFSADLGESSEVNRSPNSFPPHFLVLHSFFFQREQFRFRLILSWSVTIHVFASKTSGEVRVHNTQSIGTGWLLEKICFPRRFGELVSQASSQALPALKVAIDEQSSSIATCRVGSI